MFKLKHNEAMVLLQIIEATQFSGKDIPVIAAIMDKLHKEIEKLQKARPSHVPPNNPSGEGQKAV